MRTKRFPSGLGDLANGTRPSSKNALEQKDEVHAVGS